MTSVTQPRQRDGKFDRVRHAPEEGLLGTAHVTGIAPSGLEAGARVLARGVRGCRVLSVEDGIVVLRSPEGTKMVAGVSDVSFEPEGDEEYLANIQTEADIARLLKSVKDMNRMVKDELNRPTTDAEREALDALAMMYADGTMAVERYVYVMRATQDAPLAANHAALAIAMRHRLSPQHYKVLTEAVRSAGGVLPA